MLDPMRTYHRTRPATAGARSLSAKEVAAAYRFPTDRYTGAGHTCGIIELGGGYRPTDLKAAGIDPTRVKAIGIDGGSNTPDGPDGAEGEVALDIQIAAAIAPAAKYRVYFAPNTDTGFLHAIHSATVDACDVISISWGAPETDWDPAMMARFDQAFEGARRLGTITLAASGDTGSRDGTSSNVADFPASSPHVIGCGGTELELNPDGTRSSEVTWDINDTSSASGGGLSRTFPGRAVPDIAGNASPNTGYPVRIDGGDYIIGGTSAVAPLYAGLVLLLSEAVGGPLGGRVDLMNTLLTNLGVLFDVTVGDNGGYRAGVGRDQTTGLGVIDGTKLLDVLLDGIPDPLPLGAAPAPTPPPAPAVPIDVDQADADLDTDTRAWSDARHVTTNAAAAKAVRRWAVRKGLRQP